MLIKFRIWFYCLALIHLTFIVVYLLSIDFTKAKNPILWKYDRLRWKLITTWFNLLTLVYLPISIYCDWKELNGEKSSLHLKTLNKIRSLCFTSIILPTTTFADSFFWRLWYKDRELLAPKAVDELVPFWTQHSMHTISLVVVFLDLVLVPRRRPKSLKLGLIVMFSFIIVYLAVALHAKLQGEYIYSFVEKLTNFQCVVLFLLLFVEHFLYYISQWFIVDFKLWLQSNII